MIKSLISIKTRIEFREYFVGCTLREIRDSFDACEVRCDLNYQPPNITGQRRILVEQYYYTVNWAVRSNASRVLKVYENEICSLIGSPDLNQACSVDSNEKFQETQRAIAEKLIYWLKRDGFEWKNNRLIESSDTVVLDDLTSKLSGSHIALQIQRMKESVETDPSLVIGTAKELIETVCKTILEERGLPTIGNPDIPTLTKALLKELSLVPEGVEDAKRGSDLIKAILRSLGTIGNDLAQLRGLYGTGHGKSAQTQALQTRHAKLAVGAAATLVTFLFETHEIKQVLHEE